ncbi:MAG: cell division protein ZapA [Deltaproteobacteria bacterium]|nr:cell division protein ZapA [Deltaproteobacteria bacterium]
MSLETVKIDIGGQSINLKTENSDKLLKLAAGINEKILQVTEGTKDFNLRAAILVIINLAEELAQEREIFQEVLSQIDHKNSKIQNYLVSISDNQNE